MVSMIDELKAQARVLHRQARACDADALARLGLEPEGTRADDIKRRHCLAAIARELGFSGWPHAHAVLGGDDESDFGTLLYGGFAHTNVWSASYEEAKALRAQIGGYLLPYRRQFFIADRYFIADLGLDPEAQEWADIGRDWVRPADRQARDRLWMALIRRRQAK